jgi:molybdopterin molybdotransferase
MHPGIVENQHVRDDPEALAPIIAKALNTYDILIMTGGISRGKFDYVAPVLTELLGKPHFHGIAQRPGKTMAFWKSPDSPLVFGLPGNPVSVMACAIRYLSPALEEILSGVAPASHTLQATGTFHCPVHFTGLVPCQLKNGRIHLQAPSNSGNFLALAGTDGIAQLSGELAGKELLNEPASFYPWT